MSLTFDDARASQVHVGLPIFDRDGVRVTFFLVPSNAEERLAGWKRAVATGHEIGNHSLDHPCTGNFVWAGTRRSRTTRWSGCGSNCSTRTHACEIFWASRPMVFAYPRGQTFVGRGLDTRSYASDCPPVPFTVTQVVLSLFDSSTNPGPTLFSRNSAVTFTFVR